MLKEDNQVLLDWMTAMEENNEGFEIQHSTDGENWETLDFVRGQGTTTQTTSLFGGLESSSYTVWVEDANGCFTDSNTEKAPPFGRA